MDKRFVTLEEWKQEHKFRLDAHAPVWYMDRTSADWTLWELNAALDFRKRNKRNYPIILVGHPEQGRPQFSLYSELAS